MVLAALSIGFLKAQTFDDAIELTTDDLVVKDGEIVDVIMPAAMNNALRSDKKGKKKKHHHHKKHQKKDKLDKNDELEKLAEKLIHDFTITFNEPSAATNSTSNNNPATPENASNGTPPSQTIDKTIENWTKQIFSRPHERHRDSEGRPMKYYKDNSIPIMFRKVIPPSGQKLPLLHFKYHEDGKLCNCKCKV